MIKFGEHMNKNTCSHGEHMFKKIFGWDQKSLFLKSIYGIFIQKLVFTPKISLFGSIFYIFRKNTKSSLQIYKNIYGKTFRSKVIDEKNFNI